MAVSVAENPILRFSAPEHLAAWAESGKPLVALVPEHDDYLRPAEARERFSVVPHAEVVGVDGAKHLWVGENQTRRVLSEIVRVVNPDALAVAGLQPFSSVDFPGRLAAVHVQPGQSVQQGQVLAEVRSVDLVTDPATNKNLWESRKIATTLKRIITESKAAPKVKVALLEMGPDHLPEIREMGVGALAVKVDVRAERLQGDAALFEPLGARHRARAEHAGDLDADAFDVAVGHHLLDGGEEGWRRRAPRRDFRCALAP